MTNYLYNTVEMRENVIQKKSYEFAVKIVLLYKKIVRQHNDFIISKQLLRCGTSIGANVEEANGGQSKKDFLSKMSIAYKEARESDYWLRILKDTQMISKEEYTTINNLLQEILKIITKIQTTTKENIKNNF
ncbi:MAG TPA: four helix bundle protein [Candidatus Absconditabacterales bacterium]|nr:four helix bundle protein [Candidatus Absconditabacterales bacterium]